MTQIIPAYVDGAALETALEILRKNISGVLIKDIGAADWALTDADAQNKDIVIQNAGGAGRTITFPISANAPGAYFFYNNSGQTATVKLTAGDIGPLTILDGAKAIIVPVSLYPVFLQFV